MVREERPPSPQLAIYTFRGGAKGISTGLCRKPVDRLGDLILQDKPPTESCPHCGLRKRPLPTGRRPTPQAAVLIRLRPYWIDGAKMVAGLIQIRVPSCPFVVQSGPLTMAGNENLPPFCQKTPAPLNRPGAEKGLRQDGTSR